MYDVRWPSPLSFWETMELSRQSCMDQIALSLALIANQFQIFAWLPALIKEDIS